MNSRRLFLLLYAISGAAALMYEVAWTRLLTLQMGHTVAAASTVLAAFMGGLAIGAALAGRLNTESARRILRTYAALELLVAALAIVLPLLLAACVPVLRWAYADGDAPARFAFVRVLLSLVLLGFPAAAMGATFPVAAAWYGEAFRPRDVRSSDALAREAAGNAGALYTVNTAGAALGSVAAGFLLVPAVGLRGTTLLAAALNAAAAWGAMTIARARVPIAEDRPAQPARNAHAAKPPRHARRTEAARLATGRPAIACAAAAVSGLAALIYEVAWTRLLALVIGPTTYAFATMVAGFVIGLAIGSAAGTRLVRRSVRPLEWLAAALVLTAVASQAAAWFTASRLPLLVADQVADAGAGFERIVAFEAIAVALLLLPSTFALGAAFPLALSVATAGSTTIARDTSRVYASNTLGAIAGALVAGFLLLPRLGLQATFRSAALCGIACGGGLWVAALAESGAPRLGAAVRAAAVAAVAALALAAPRWDRELLASGVYKYAPYMHAGDLDTAVHAGRLEYYKEGAAGTVSVRRLAGTVSLAIDGKVDASNAGDMLTQRMLGLLPILLHDRARTVCVIGLGSGVTVESALATGSVVRADVLEISPEVVEASAFFARESANPLGAANVRLIVADGRSHLLLTRRKYDVIVSEPSNPWMAGVASLFTREFFEAARARLEPDGLLCQWAHTYDISARDLKSIVRTFASVFPDGTLWLVGDGDLLLIGSNGASIASRLGGIGRRLSLGSASAFLTDVSDPRVMAPGFQLLSMYAGGPQELLQYGDDAPIQRDDRTALEFSAPRAIYGRSTNDNTAAIRGLADRAQRPQVVHAVVDTGTDVSWTARGLMNLKAEAFQSAYEDLRHAVTLNGRNGVALRGLSDAAAGAGRQEEHRRWLESLAAAQPANPAARIELSRVRAAQGDMAGALAAASEAMQLAPDDPEAGEQLASVLADAGDADRLGPLADKLLTRFPNREEARYYRATALYMSGRTQEAIDEARRVVAARPGHARAQGLLGAACAASGQHDCAKTAFEAAVRANPRDATAYVNLGVFRMQSADPAGAADYFAEALTLDPASTSARQGLAQARAALGKS